MQSGGILLVEIVSRNSDQRGHQDVTEKSGTFLNEKSPIFSYIYFLSLTPNRWHTTPSYKSLKSPTELIHFVAFPETSPNWMFYWRFHQRVVPEVLRIR